MFRVTHAILILVVYNKNPVFSAIRQKFAIYMVFVMLHGNVSFSCLVLPY